MEVINGTIREFVYTGAGVPSGFVIDGGMEVHFSPMRALNAAPLLLLGACLKSAAWRAAVLPANRIWTPCGSPVMTVTAPSIFRNCLPPLNQGRRSETAPPVESTSLIPPSRLRDPANPTFADSLAEKVSGA